MEKMACIYWIKSRINKIVRRANQFKKTYCMMTMRVLLKKQKML